MACRCWSPRNSSASALHARCSLRCRFTSSSSSPSPSRCCSPTWCSTCPSCCCPSRSAASRIRAARATSARRDGIYASPIQAPLPRWGERLGEGDTHVVAPSPSLSPYRGERNARRGEERLTFRQRDEFRIARHLGEAAVAPVGLGLLDTLLGRRYEVPPDVARSVDRGAAQQHHLGSLRAGDRVDWLAGMKRCEVANTKQPVTDGQAAFGDISCTLDMLGRDR